MSKVDLPNFAEMEVEQLRTIKRQYDFAIAKLHPELVFSKLEARVFRELLNRPDGMTPSAMGTMFMASSSKLHPVLTSMRQAGFLDVRRAKHGDTKGTRNYYFVPESV